MQYGYSYGSSLSQSSTGFTPAPITVELVGGTGNISVDSETMIVTVEITSPSRLAALDEGHPNGPGWFERSATGIHEAPLLLTQPALSGTAEPGAPLSFDAAVWLVGQPAAQTSVSFVLERNTGAGYIAVSGYVGQEYGSVAPYTIGDGDQDSSFRLRETVQAGPAGSATADSPEVYVPQALEPGTLPTLAAAPVNQDEDLASNGTPTETIAGGLPAAGRFIIGIVDLNANGLADLSVESASITSTIALGTTTGAGNTHITMLMVNADGAGDLTVRNNSTITSFARQVVVLQADKMLESGFLFASTVGSGGGANPLSVSFGDVPANRVAVAIGATRAAGSPVGVTWGGDVTDSDELSDLSFTNTAHRAAAAVTNSTAQGADFTVLASFDGSAGSSVAFALATVLFEVEVPVQITVQDTHPGFQRAQYDAALTQVNGWGDGNHYTLEVDSSDLTRMVVEPGETTKVWYCADTARGGLTASDIETAESLSGGTVDAAWLNAQTTTTYGLRSDQPIEWATLGIDVNQAYMRSSNTSNRGRSYWFLFAQDSVHPTGGLNPYQGESPLHPHYYGDYQRPLQSAGAKPVFNGSVVRTLGGGLGDVFNVAYGGLHFENSSQAYIATGANIVYAGCKATGASADKEHFAFQAPGSWGSIDRVTLYGIHSTDACVDEPTNGSTWDVDQTSGTGNASDRTSAVYAEYTEGMLAWRCFIDHAGWQSDYNPDGFSWNNGEFGKPPAIYSHSLYWNSNNYGMSVTELLSTRAAGTSVQFRSSGMMNCVVSVDPGEMGNAGKGVNYLYTDDSTRVGGFSNGETVVIATASGDITFVMDGNYSTANERFVVQPAISGDIVANIAAGDVATGQSSGATVELTGVYEQTGNYAAVHSLLQMGSAYRPLSARNPNIYWGGLLTYFSPDWVLKQGLAINGADPNNSAEVTQRSPITVSNAWTPVKTDSFEYAADYRIENWFSTPAFNAGSITNPTEITLGAWYDLNNSQAVGTTTTDQACEAIRLMPDAALQAKEIWNHAASRTGDQQIGHVGGVTRTFLPDPDVDGYRADWLGSWVEGDWPVDGDSVDLNGNVMQSYQTFRLADLDFGTGGGLRMYGGLISCSSSQAASAGSVELQNAAKFRVSGTQSTAYIVTADNGRYEVDGTISGVSGDFSGKSQCIIFAGGSLTVGAGQTLTLRGGAVKAGFDGTSGTGTLTLQGTLVLEQVDGVLPRIREIRTGRFGLEDLGNEVEGQPVATNMTSQVVLGGTLSVDVTGLSGTYLIIDVDSLSGNFASAEITGGSGSVLVDESVGRVFLTVN